jgi:UDPglucose 6-dehydrogenase
MKVGIAGLGWVGQAMTSLFPDAYIYDPGRKLGNKEGLNKCDVCFICVPTPNADNTDLAKYATVRGEGHLDTSIVEEVISWCECPLLVVRSTINPGDCDTWENRYEKTLVFQPEYLGETVAHPLLDPKTRPFLIIGGNSENRRKLIDLYMTVYNANIDIRQVSLREAEIIKLSENRAIAWKVAQCQELYDICEKDGVDYYTIRQAVYGDDPRFDLWFTAVYLDKRGMNSKCIPKDVYAWCAWAESLGYEPKITRALLEKNKEWINK